ncbi:MAG: M23 family metallopeptidase [Leptolyngbya sp. Prado105]|jgi:murein DD-endopeptidase MepM/ murein hydrolase activator NlpD|nr:M23 family metallopeptidase [Leptolyngbya sp. Prado105]
MTHSLLLSNWTRTLIISGLGWLIGFSALARPTQAQAPVDVLPPTPSAAPAAIEIQPAQVTPVGGDAFIDKTDYSLGATDRSTPPAVIAQPPAAIAAPRDRSPAESVSLAPVEVGGFNLSVTGINWAAAQSNPIGSAYGTVQNYYNRTVRPFGRIGNGDLRLIFPLSIPAPITSVFGWRVHPISGNTRLHTGTDLGAPLGTPVLAALTGRVILSEFFSGYGLSVALEHNAGAQQTLYAHLSEIFVKPGDIVKQGAVIGRVGSTGNSTGPHLHFEVRQQTTDGWVAMDSGVVLENAMAELVKSMQVAQKPIQR